LSSTYDEEEAFESIFLFFFASKWWVLSWKL
jgi:hypothetical protein